MFISLNSLPDLVDGLHLALCGIPGLCEVDSVTLPVIVLVFYFKL